MCNCNANMASVNVFIYWIPVASKVLLQLCFFFPAPSFLAENIISPSRTSNQYAGNDINSNLFNRKLTTEADAVERLKASQQMREEAELLLNVARAKTSAAVMPGQRYASPDIRSPSSKTIAYADASEYGGTDERPRRKWVYFIRIILMLRRIELTKFSRMRARTTRYENQILSLTSNIHQPRPYCHQGRREGGCGVVTSPPEKASVGNWNLKPAFFRSW